MIDLLASVSPMVAGALVAAVWQGTLLTVLAWVCLKAFPRLSAAARSAVWLGVFVLLIGLQIVPVLARPAAEAVSIPVAHLDVRWSYAVLGLWAAFSVARAVQLGIGVVHMRRLVVRAVEIDAGPELKAALDEAAAGRAVRFCTSDEIARPSVIGFFNPTILIPEKLLRSLSEAELKQVLIHEVEHLRRADDWTNLLQKLALVVFPLNPALLWVERKLCAERELACDDRVLEAGNGRKAYALCLAHLAEHAMLQRGMSLALGAWEKRPELVRRVERILRGGPKTLGRRIAVGVAGGVMTASLCGALLLARSPAVVSFAPAMELAQEDGLPAALPEGLKPIPVVSHGVQAKTCAFTIRAAQPKPKRVKMQKAKPAKAQVKLAGLRVAPQPGGGKLLLMSEWSDLGVQQRILLAELREGSGRAPMAVPAIYVVATPAGVVIVEI
jgi:beta-lactamase regulating signal transducer with metallopeptidase domain